MSANRLLWPVISFIGSLAFWTFAYQSFVPAVILMVVILIHEMGHFIAAKHYGLKVEPPLFVIIGAFVKFENDPKTVKDDVIVSIAGPLFGGVAAAAMWGCAYITGDPVILAAARFGFLLNLMQLIPIPPLDGGHIARGLERRLWKLGAAIVVAYSAYAAFFMGNFAPAVFVFLFWSGTKKHMQEVEQKAASEPEAYNLAAGERTKWLAIYAVLTVALALGWWFTRHATLAI